MKFLSDLFSNNNGEKALQNAAALIKLIIEDEEFQLELLHPSIRNIVKSGQDYDKDPNGTGPFGFTETNPIPVNGAIGELAYLSRLETVSGQRILFHRLGSKRTVDVFEAVTFDGSEWFIFYLDLYHPRRTRLVPEGFSFTKGPALFSGFHQFCDNFPYDFADNKNALMGSILGMAYIPILEVLENCEHRAFNRPRVHELNIEYVRSRLSAIPA